MTLQVLSTVVLVAPVYFQRFKAKAGILISMSALMYLLNYSLPERTENLVFTVKVSRVLTLKRMPGSLEASGAGVGGRVVTGKNALPWILTSLSKIFLEHSTDPLCLEWWKDIPGWAAIFHTVCSPWMLSVNDSGKGKLHRILVQRKKKL